MALAAAKGAHRRADARPERGTQEQDPAILFLAEDGLIQDCNRACEGLLGGHRSELVCQHVSRVVPRLAHVALLEGGEINARLRFLMRLGAPFDVYCLDGASFSGELFLSEISSVSRQGLRLILRRSGMESASPDGREVSRGNACLSRRFQV